MIPELGHCFNLFFFYCSGDLENKIIILLSTLKETFNSSEQLSEGVTLD